MNRVLGITRSRAGRVGLVVGVAAAALLGLSAPASAHLPQVKGWTSCSNGEHVVLWQIGNNFVLPMTIVSATAELNGQPYPVTGWTSPVVEDATTSATTIVPNGMTGTITMTAHGEWPDGVSTSDHVSVDILSDCNGGSTTTTTTTTGPPTTEATTTTTGVVVQGSTTTVAPPTTAPPTTAPPTAPPTTVAATPPTTDVVVQGSTSTLAPTTTTGPPAGGGITTTTAPGGPATTTPESGEGGPDTTTTTGPQGAVNLPRTGNDTNFPLLFGAACVGAGALLALRRRRAWNR